MEDKNNEQRDSRLRGNSKAFWITGAHPITGFVVPSAVERRQKERPAKLVKVKPETNWR